MTETINTCSGALSFAKSLENDSAAFYSAMADRFSEHKDTFSSFVKENQRYVTDVERAYYGVITDAFEGCFAFNLRPDAYTVDAALPAQTTYPEALHKAVEMEETMVRFYTDAAEQSKSLMADVPRAFKMVVKKRGRRQELLKELLAKAR